MTRFLLSSVFVGVNFFVLFNTIIAQADSSLFCNPQRITQGQFEEVTDKILSYSPVTKSIKSLSSNSNCVLYITNDFDSENLSGFVFYLDSNNHIHKGFFVRFNSIDTNKQHLIPLRQKQLQKFRSLRIDTSQKHFLYCRTNTLHEKWEIVISLNKNQLIGGLYFIGSRLLAINQTEKSIGLIKFREEIRYIKIPKK
jgi:hypothetical protein